MEVDVSALTRVHDIEQIDLPLGLLGQRELAMREVPTSMRTMFVYNGYRPVGRRWRFYFCSLFRWHNESLPIWSHLLALVAWFIVYSQWLMAGAPHPETMEQLFGSSTSFFVNLHHISLGTIFAASTVYHLLNSVSPYIRFAFELADVGTVCLVVFVCSAQMAASSTLPDNVRLMTFGSCWFGAILVGLRALCLAKDQAAFHEYCEGVSNGDKAVAFKKLAWPLAPFLLIAAVAASGWLVANNGLMLGLGPNVVVAAALTAYWHQWPECDERFRNLTNAQLQASHTIFHVGVAIWAFGCMRSCSA